MRKFSALHEILLAEGLACASDVVAPTPASWDDLRTVHDEAYLRKLATGTMTAGEERRLGVPWSPALVRRSRLAVTGTLNAARSALEDGVAGNLGGGTHHSFPDHGEGFCVLNDILYTVSMLRRSGRAQRFLLIDLDVHQGNGNAFAFADDPDVFTFSMHGAKNYPLHKPPSSLDVGLADGTDDETYLRTLRSALQDVARRSRPDLVFYLAGVDPVAGDRYGRLRLTRDGLARRDRMVIDHVRDRGLPQVLLLSGGYAPTPELTADLHATVFREALSRRACSAQAVR
jgi:acetoin utilization deacetylase AcuC-like enzyme